MLRALLLLVLLPASAWAGKPIDTRLNAVFHSAAHVARICKDYGARIDKKAFEALVLQKVPRAPAEPDKEIAIAVPARGERETCSLLVNTLLHDGELWVRIQVPTEVDDYLDVHWRGTPGHGPKYLGTFVPYFSPLCVQETNLPPQKVLGLKPKEFRALPAPVHAFLCRS